MHLIKLLDFCLLMGWFVFYFDFDLVLVLGI